MASIGGPNLVNSGLIFGYDTGQPIFSNNRNTRLYLGRPTTNISSGIGMSTYNNVPGNVSSVLEGLSETFQGAQVIKQTLTPADASGVSYLSNGNNPGIGVVTGGGGGTANRYTGHSIFFKPTVPMHSSPIFTNYSNIGGWQSSNLYEAVGDGWFRAYVTWYNTVTQSDGKYWAINPQQAVVNQPIVIYWAGPFKEDLNSQAVSPYVFSSRSSTDALIDLKRTYSLDISGVSFSSTTNALLFDGSDDYIDIPSTSLISGTQDFTIEAAYNMTGQAGGAIFGNYGPGYTSNHIWFSGQYGFYLAGDAYAPGYPLANGKYHMVATRSSGVVRLYLNGTQVNSATLNTSVATNVNYRIGKDVNSSAEPFTGEIYTVRIYNRALSASEVSQNYQAFKPRFGL